MSRRSLGPEDEAESERERSGVDEARSSGGAAARLPIEPGGSMGDEVDDPDPVAERLDRDRAGRREQAVGRVGAGAVDDQLPVVGQPEAVVAGLVAGDEAGRRRPSRRSGRRSRGGRRGPRSGRRRSRPASSPRRARRRCGGRGRGRGRPGRAVGDRVAEEDAVRRPDGQRERAEELVVGRDHRRGPSRRRRSRSRGGTGRSAPSPPLAIGRPVSSESSWLPRIRWTRSGLLALQGRDHVDELVRPVAAVVGVERARRGRAPGGPGAGRGCPFRSAIASILRKAGMLPCRSPTTRTSSASVAGEVDDAADAARRGPAEQGGAADEGEHLAGSGMGVAFGPGGGGRRSIIDRSSQGL